MLHKNVTPSTTGSSPEHNGLPSATNVQRLAEIRARLDEWRADRDATEADIYFYVSVHDTAWLVEECERARMSGRAWRGLARRMKPYKDEYPFDERPHGYHRQVAEAEWHAALGKETPFEVALLGGQKRVDWLRPAWKANIRQIRARAKRLRLEADDA